MGETVIKLFINRETGTNHDELYYLDQWGN